MNIQKAVNAAGRIEIGQQINNVYDTDGRKDSCLEHLYITDPVADKQRIEDDKGGLLKDCYSWILENDDFIQWRDDPHYRLLWIKGDPGKGKTMLLAGLITELEKTSDDGIFYFFCQAEQPLLRTAPYVLRGLIWFIVRKRPALISYVHNEYDQAGKSIFSNHNAWQAVSGILTTILEDEASADCIILIDALDECSQEREKLIDYISQRSVSCKAKWVISSRNWPDIESQLDATQRQVRLHLELNHASISNAVVKFVDRKITQLNSTYSEPNRAQIRKHLLENANDTFLWVALVSQELGKPGVKHYHSSSILQRFPPGLSELYGRMVSDINDRDMHWCRAILAVIAVALRPLSFQELAAADGALTEWAEDEETLSSLVASCGSLLTIRGNTVYTVHQSVNDFLLTAPKILLSGIAHQQLSIFLSSIKVMQHMLHRNLYDLEDNCAPIGDIAVLPKAPLTIAGYACIYWVDHFCEWPLTDNQHQNNLCYTMITQLLQSKYLYWLEAMSLLRCTSEAIKAMQRLEEKLEDRVSGELKPLVNDAVRFASTHRTIMDAAPLQLYDSALIFSPQLSKIKRCFSREISKSINVLSPDFQHWGACLQTIPGLASHVENFAICEFSPDGRNIATINTNNDSIILIDASTGELVKSTDIPGGRLREFTFHPSGDLLVILSDDIDDIDGIRDIEEIGDREDITKMYILRLSDGECSKGFTVPKIGYPTSLSLSPDGQLVALVSDLGTVDIWNLASETKMDGCHMTPRSNVEYIAWIHTVSYPQALLILRSCDISIWCLENTHQMVKIMSLERIEFPDVSKVSRDRTCCAVFQGGEELVLYSWGSSITVHKIGRFDEGKCIDDASWVGDGLIAICGDFGIEVWDIEAKRLIAHLQGDPAEAICYGENRQLASLGFRNSILKIWSLDTILSHPELITQQSANIVEAFITSPRGRVAVISNDGEFDRLSIAANGKFHHLPKTLQHSSPESRYRPESLAFGQDDYFAVATDTDAIEIFNFNHDTGLYYCERWIRQHLAAEHISLTIQFWGQQQIITRGDCITFWDLKTGECSRCLPAPYPFRRCPSAITANGLIAMRHGRSRVVIWDITRGKEAQHFDVDFLYPDLREISNISLNSSGTLAISAIGDDEKFIALGSVEDGTWIRWLSIPDNVPTLNFLAPKLRLDTGFGVLKYHMEHGGSKSMPTVAADHWDPRYLSLSYLKSEAWLMRGSRRILWIPRQDVDPERFSIQTDLEARISTVTLVHDRCLFVLTIDVDSI
ncbi:hypothetical protein H9Q72_010098 [Fusarium xylarioides]|uniref:NACHT domain-containing protein n=1 Tax=Fusarium xylarioides TaxID=221167 RepID=A0A9P7HJG9_9HYPO|nr:hypothetical protein H9Q72_010098 [Fusarium xylarioides]